MNKTLVALLLSFAMCGAAAAADKINIQHMGEAAISDGYVAEIFCFDLDPTSPAVYKDLTINIRFLDKNGKNLYVSEIEPFTIGGGKGAKRFSISSAEAPEETLDETVSIRIDKATYINAAGKEVRLPASAFVTKRFKPIPISSSK